MNVLITGASGMIGSFVADKLLEQGYTVIGVDYKEAVASNEKYIHEIVDLSDISALRRVYSEHRIDRTIHFAALAHTAGEDDLSWNRYYKINVECAKNVFIASSEKRIPILQISTVDVFGFTKGAVSADTPIHPVTNYGKSKALAEKKLKAVCAKYGNSYSIYRFSPVYTPEIKRDIQKRYYLKYPNIAYLIGDSTEYEVLDINNAAKAVLGWLDYEPGNETRIIKDPERMNTREYLSREVKEGRAKIILWFPEWLVKLGYTVIHGVLGDNSKTYLLNKAVSPLRSGTAEEIERFKGKHILILEGYARQCLPYMREFKKFGCEISLLCHSKLDCGYASRLPDHKILGICDPDEYEASEKYIVKLIKTGKYDMVFPLVDFSARILSEHKDELSKYAVIYSNDRKVFEASQNKLSLMKTCKKLGIPHPETLTNISTVEDVLDKKPVFPIIIKPQKGCGAKGFSRFETENEFVRYVKDNDIDLSEMVVQECIPSDSLVLSDNIFIERNGRIKSSFLYGSHRVFPISGGTGTFNMTFSRKDIHIQCAKLVKALGLRGPVGVDLMIDSRDNIAKVIEINPRVLACSEIGFAAGVNQAQQVLEDAFGYEVKPYMKYQTGIKMRMTQTDVFWFLKSPKRFSAKPSWFDFIGTKDQMFALKDPLPWFAFLFRGLNRLGKWKKEHK